MRRLALGPKLALGIAGWISLGGAAPVASLEIDVAGLRSTSGLIQLCLTANPDKFPSCTGDARALTRTVPAGQGQLRFAALPQGDWAVAVIHDANGNGRLDTVMGIPREGFGFSNNPAIGFGAPRFAAARFRLGGDASETIRMRYLL